MEFDEEMLEELWSAFNTERKENSTEERIIFKRMLRGVSIHHYELNLKKSIEKKDGHSLSVELELLKAGQVRLQNQINSLQQQTNQHLANMNVEIESIRQALSSEAKILKKKSEIEFVFALER